ncbi:MAG TPA: RNA polymerase sigma factor [Armatimonadota bacterium]|nr:RNA polymerase sigma factor [Armatimonadota bacterium]
MEALSDAGDAVALDRPRATGARADLGGLYDGHAAAVYRLLLAVLRSPEDAQDALGEVFLKAARRDWRRIRNPRAYLLASARNQAISMLRRPHREQPTDPSHACFFDASCLDQEQALPVERAEGALRELPPDQREVVVLKVYEGLTFAEIAAITRARPNTVASRYRYAIEKLRRALGGAE